MYCGSTECNVFVCANAHVHSQRFHYILGDDGWMAFCWLLVCCIVSFFFSVHINKTCYLPLSSWHRIDYLLRISNMKYAFNNCYFANVEWHANLLQG